MPVRSASPLVGLEIASGSISDSIIHRVANGCTSIQSMERLQLSMHMWFLTLSCHSFPHHKSEHVYDI